METYPNSRHIPYAPTETARLHTILGKSRTCNGDHYGKTVQS